MAYETKNDLGNTVFQDYAKTFHVLCSPYDSILVKKRYYRFSDLSLRLVIQFYVALRKIYVRFVNHEESNYNS